MGPWKPTFTILHRDKLLICTCTYIASYISSLCQRLQANEKTLTFSREIIGQELGPLYSDEMFYCLNIMKTYVEIKQSSSQEY